MSFSCLYCILFTFERKDTPREDIILLLFCIIRAELELYKKAKELCRSSRPAGAATQGPGRVVRGVVPRH